MPNGPVSGLRRPCATDPEPKAIGGMRAPKVSRWTCGMRLLTPHHTAAVGEMLNDRFG